MNYYESTIVRCPRCGQQYNSAAFASCPYCPPAPSPYQQTVSYQQPFQAPQPPAPQFPQPAPSFPQPEPQFQQPAPPFPQPAPQFPQSAPQFPQPEPIQNTHQAYVTGWLVCVSGNCKGRSFELRIGFNEISAQYDTISIQYSPKPSPSSHSRILYDAAKNNFVFLRGGSMEMISINDSPVGREPVQLMPYSHILVGDSKFVLIVLCGKNFSWSCPEKNISYSPAEENIVPEPAAAPAGKPAKAAAPVPVPGSAEPFAPLPSEPDASAEAFAPLPVESPIPEPAPAPIPEPAPAPIPEPAPAPIPEEPAKQDIPAARPFAPAKLRAVFGPCTDAVFDIREGHNKIGRTTGDIIIPDNAVSSENDCAISFDAHTGRYTIINGEGKNPVSLNGMQVISETELRPGDKITIGFTILEFTAD